MSAIVNVDTSIYSSVKGKDLTSNSVSTSKGKDSTSKIKDIISKSKESCPRCTCEESIALTVNLPANFDKKLMLTNAVRKEITTDGTVDIIVCPDCGFKWIHNSGSFTTSQLSNFILQDFMQSVYRALVTSNKELIGDMLCVLSEIGATEKHDFSELPEQRSMSDRGLWLIKTLQEFIEDSTADDLLELYNSYRDAMGYYKLPYAADVTLPNTDLEDLPDPPRVMKAQDLLVDD